MKTSANKWYSDIWVLDKSGQYATKGRMVGYTDDGYMVEFENGEQHEVSPSDIMYLKKYNIIQQDINRGNKKVAMTGDFDTTTSSTNLSSYRNIINQEINRAMILKESPSIYNTQWIYWMPK